MTDPKHMTNQELDAAVAEAIGQTEKPNPFWSPSNNLHDAQRAVIEFIELHKRWGNDCIWGEYHPENQARKLAETIVVAYREAE